MVYFDSLNEELGHVLDKIRDDAATGFQAAKNEFELADIQKQLSKDILGIAGNHVDILKRIKKTEDNLKGRIDYLAEQNKTCAAVTTTYQAKNNAYTVRNNTIAQNIATTIEYATGIASDHAALQALANAADSGTMIYEHIKTASEIAQKTVEAWEAISIQSLQLNVDSAALNSANTLHDAEKLKKQITDINTQTNALFNTILDYVTTEPNETAHSRQLRDTNEQEWFIKKAAFEVAEQNRQGLLSDIAASVNFDELLKHLVKDHRYWGVEPKEITIPKYEASKMALLSQLQESVLQDEFEERKALINHKNYEQLSIISNAMLERTKTIHDATADRTEAITLATRLVHLNYKDIKQQAEVIAGIKQQYTSFLNSLYAATVHALEIKIATSELAKYIVRHKASNPLISDELVQMAQQILPAATELISHTLNTLQQTVIADTELSELQHLLNTIITELDRTIYFLENDTDGLVKPAEHALKECATIYKNQETEVQRTIYTLQEMKETLQNATDKKEVAIAALKAAECV